jgi:hypothetical protein
MPTSTARTSRATEAARKRREKLRAQGLREVRIPDTRSPDFAAEARRQSLAVANSPMAKEDQDFIDAISAPWDE